VVRAIGASLYRMEQILQHLERAWVPHPGLWSVLSSAHGAIPKSVGVSCCSPDNGRVTDPTYAQSGSQTADGDGVPESGTRTYWSGVFRVPWNQVDEYLDTNRREPEDRLAAVIKREFTGLRTPIREMADRMEARFDSINAELDRQNEMLQSALSEGERVFGPDKLK